ncbi:histone-lysine N-methyltransferase SETMAR [Plakobranchus ocellatus]|uniref:Histone-lysine N-methyltransferase SETMAR n=1 Tax=Plakobranchus ocellatus TaxID=259542 RepID=A0AAV4CMJ0_9GAST|nr:histone-lysine N-methyltransferase SETMAR [Plakobranchus ocellatus]
MATVFWDAKGVILLDILPQGQCINAARYCSTLDRLKEAIRRKRPGLLRRGVVLQHDNATPHSANLTQQWLQRYGWEILPHLCLISNVYCVTAFYAFIPTSPRYNLSFCFKI